MADRQGLPLGFEDFNWVCKRREKAEMWSSISRDFPSLSAEALRKRFKKMEAALRVASREPSSDVQSPTKDKVVLNASHAHREDAIEGSRTNQSVKLDGTADSLSSDTAPGSSPSPNNGSPSRSSSIQSEVAQFANKASGKKINSRKRTAASASGMQTPTGQDEPRLDLLVEYSVKRLRDSRWGFKDLASSEAKDADERESIFESTMEKMSIMLQSTLKRHSELESALRQQLKEKEGARQLSQQAEQKEQSTEMTTQDVRCDTCPKLQATLKDKDRMIRNCDSIETDLRQTIGTKDREIGYVREMHAKELSRHEKETLELEKQLSEQEAKLLNAQTASEKAENLLQEQLDVANQEISKLKSQLKTTHHLAKPDPTPIASKTTAAPTEGDPNVLSKTPPKIKAMTNEQPSTPSSAISSSGIDPHLLTLTAKKERKERPPRALREQLKKEGYCYDYHLHGKHDGEASCGVNDCKLKHGTVLEGEKKRALAYIMRRETRKSGKS